MALDSNRWNSTFEGWSLPGVTDVEFVEFEKSQQLKLPAFLKDMYRIQNGGIPCDSDDFDFFFLPIGRSLQMLPPTGSLWELVLRDAFLDSSDLEDIEEEFGDVKRIICFAQAFGHMMYALNYNQTNSDGEPAVISLANDGGGNGTEADSFAAWMNERFGTETAVVLDWAEHERYPVLFQSTMGIPAVKEWVLCQDGERGLRLYERRMPGGRTTEIKRATLSKGVSRNWLKVTKFGQVGQLYSLHLQPVERDDIQWMTCQLRSNGEWKMEQSQGIPVYAMLMSEDQQGLEELVQTLKNRKFAQ